MLIVHYVTNNNEANLFFIGCEETGEAMMVDAGAFDLRYHRFLERHHLRLTKVFITHDHYDHIESLTQICTRIGTDDVTIYGASPRANWTPIGEGETISIGNHEAKVVDTSGHTEDSLSLVVDGRAAFVGDCLFAGSIGGTHSAKQKQREIDNIKNKLFPLGDHVEIYPGHGAPTTVGVERTSNPFLTESLHRVV